MLRVCIFVLCCLQLHAEEYRLINLCSVQYVQPGTNFELLCETDRGASTRIFLPSEELPVHNAIMRQNERFEEESRQTITINKYENATEDDEGIYSCLIHHGPGVDEVYSVATCEVIVKDLCADANCTAGETCTADYQEGTSECKCDFDCGTNFEPVCTDTCELYWNECSLEEAICIDKKARQVDRPGFCPEFVEPTTRKISGVQKVLADAGENVILAAGVVVDGTPLASITWIFYPEDGDGDGVEILNVRETYEFTADTSFAGDYEITIMHCMNAEKAVVNRYSVSINNAAEEATATPTPDLSPDNLVTGAYYVCSVYPAGALESFYGEAAYYDLACSHVLASDVLVGGDYSNPWFIYGSFDEHDGKGAMKSMSFYLGRNVFEFQRGWIINLDGEKMLLDEGVPRQVAESDCFVIFENMHLNLDCPYFEAYYDGIMSGHIRMKGDRTVEAITKGRGNFGLCFDNMSGWRKNWQVGGTGGACAVSTEAAACSEDQDEECDLYQEPLNLDDWAGCGSGASLSCNELNCGRSVATSAQACSLKQAARVSCALKYGESLDGLEPECPKNGCDWKLDVVSRGCPQKDPPFECL